MINKRLIIISGHFGSGKSEIAVNLACMLKKNGKKAAIADLDIVNPYFRSNDLRAFLEKKGIKVISSKYAGTNSDVPALPADLNVIFEDKSYTAVLDIGGDDIGAKAVARYKDFIISDSYEHLIAVNTKRPMTDTPEKIERMIDEIKTSSNIKVTGLINNTNLLYDTNYNIIEKGRIIIERVSEKTGIPIRFECILENVEIPYTKKSVYDIIKIKRNIKTAWSF